MRPGALTLIFCFISMGAAYGEESIDPLLLLSLNQNSGSSTPQPSSGGPLGGNNPSPGQSLANAYCAGQCEKAQTRAALADQALNSDVGADGEAGSRQVFPNPFAEPASTEGLGNPNSIILGLSRENPELVEKLLNDPVFLGKLQADPVLMQSFLRDLGIAPEQVEANEGRGASSTPAAFTSYPACFASCIREFQLSSRPPESSNNNTLQLLLLQQASASPPNPQPNFFAIPESQIADFSDMDDSTSNDSGGSNNNEDDDDDDE